MAGTGDSTMQTLPYRATLPNPLPTNPLRRPSGTLDALVVRFRVREDSVTVESPATQCSATYWCATGEGALSYDGRDEDFPQDVPVTLGEVRSLEGLDDIANRWDEAVKAGDRAALKALADSIRRMAPPQGLTLRVEGT